MITYYSKKCKCFSQKILNNITKAQNIVKKDINAIYNFSNKLEIISINELDGGSYSYDVLFLIKAYELEMNINDFSKYKCPCCKKCDTLHNHKEYERNIIFHVGNYEISAIIKITVLECSYCKSNNKDKQHYHALLPEFIFPYHIYSGSIIIDTLYERLVKDIKIQTIINEKRISHELFYKWLTGLKKYAISASTILGIPNDLINIIKKIKDDINLFLSDFYKQYYHPFFLFKLTCVPLAIMP